ncbi:MULTISPECIES: hypothetical protein [Bacillaceae]
MIQFRFPNNRVDEWYIDYSYFEKQVLLVMITISKKGYFTRKQIDKE